MARSPHSRIFLPRLREVLWDGVKLELEALERPETERQTFKSYLEGVRGVQSVFDPHS